MPNPRGKRLSQSTSTNNGQGKRKNSVSPETRANLVTLGIPEKDHTFNRLLRLLPGEAAGGRLSTDALAKLLVRRVKQRMLMKMQWLAKMPNPGRPRTHGLSVQQPPQQKGQSSEKKKLA